MSTPQPSICSHSLMLCAEQKSNKYLLHSLSYDSIYQDQTHDQPHSRSAHKSFHHPNGLISLKKDVSALKKYFTYIFFLKLLYFTVNHFVSIIWISALTKIQISNSAYTIRSWNNLHAADQQFPPLIKMTPNDKCHFPSHLPFF